MGSGSDIQNPSQCLNELDILLSLIKCRFYHLWKGIILLTSQNCYESQGQSGMWSASPCLTLAWSGRYMSRVLETLNPVLHEYRSWSLFCHSRCQDTLSWLCCWSLREPLMTEQQCDFCPRQNSLPSWCLTFLWTSPLFSPGAKALHMCVYSRNYMVLLLALYMLYF